ncbi:AAA family ATPase [Candidatus Poriferisodalis sp.]|uniref:AAA family ATPase n=1 Tax=Candidatus Poriferisodalis sp. TaxID=3101277 RepID=UPI003B0164BD
MKIIKLEAENIKRLRAVEIRPDGNLVEITGRNGQGKTSVLDSILWAIAGTRTHQKQPIRDGEQVARINLDLGEIVVRRQFIDEDGKTATRLRVEAASGAEFSSPQKMLDGLLGTLSFDPLEFIRAAPKDQFETLRQFVDGVDFVKMDRLNREAYDERRVINREAKKQRSAAGQVQVPEDVPTELVSVQELVAELNQANEANELIAREQRDVGRKRERLAEIKIEVEDCARRLERLQTEREGIENDLEFADEIQAPVDTTSIRLRLDNAEALNDAYRQRQRRDELLASAREAEDKSAKLTAAMTKRTRQVNEAIAAADMPVDGLTLADGAVLLNDVPLEQASDAEQLRLSCAVAMRQNAKLRVIRIRDGSLLDEQGLELLRGMADEHDYQIWIERVDSSGRVGFVIEDGTVMEQGRSR